MNWKDMVDRFALLFNEKVREIRRDVPADLIVQKTVESLVAAGFEPKDSGPLDVDMTALSELFGQINGNARSRIILLANRIGSVVDDDTPRTGESSPDSRFAGEDRDNVYMRTDGLMVRIFKDDLIKYLTLGSLP